MEYSKYQEAIYDEVVNSKTNILISAVAGSGKTTTIVDCLSLLPKREEVIFLAFNNFIVKTLSERIKKQSNVEITTIHSFGWRSILRQTRGTAKMEKNKAINYIAPLLIKYEIEKKKQGYYFYLLSKVVDIARLNLVNTPVALNDLCMRHDFILTEGEIEMCIELLKIMDKDKINFDFADMVYYPAVNDIRMKQFKYVIVDEAQDLSEAQQAIISKIKAPDGRLIAVYDPRQAIYGFAGADIDSCNKLKTLFPNTVELPLSVSYRCPKSVVRLAQRFNPDIEFFEDNIEGRTGSVGVAEIKNYDWVLCRNLKPLIYLNLYFLSKGIKSFVKGKDIGNGLIAMVKKTGCEGIKAMIIKLKGNLSSERMKLIKRGISLKNIDNVGKIVSMNEKLEILSILSQNVNTTAALIKKLEDIFVDQDRGICLSTIHKSKGLENDRVFIICPELMPSKYATQEWQLLQERNLQYVAITRAKKELLIINDYNEVVLPEIRDLLDLIDLY